MDKEVFSEKEYYRQKIIEMVGKIDSVVFLRQIWTILKRHIEKGGN